MCVRGRLHRLSCTWHHHCERDSGGGFIDLPGLLCLQSPRLTLGSCIIVLLRNNPDNPAEAVMQGRESIVITAVIVALVAQLKRTEDRLANTESNVADCQLRAVEFERRVLEKIDIRERSAELRLNEAEKTYEERAVKSQMVVESNIADMSQSHEKTFTSLASEMTSAIASFQKSVDDARRAIERDVTTLMQRMDSVENHLRPDLRGRDLGSMDLHHLDLPRSKFDSLRGANLNHMDLSGINLSGMVLETVSFLSANLTNADLSGSVMHPWFLCGATLTNANLSNARISWINPFFASLKGGRCEPPNINGTDLRGLQFSIRGVWEDLFGTSQSLGMTNFNHYKSWFNAKNLPSDAALVLCIGHIENINPANCRPETEPHPKFNTLAEYVKYRGARID